MEQELQSTVLNIAKKHADVLTKKLVLKLQ
jgi:hypothetical protein